MKYGKYKLHVWNHQAAWFISPNSQNFEGSDPIPWWVDPMLTLELELITSYNLFVLTIAGMNPIFPNHSIFFCANPMDRPQKSNSTVIFWWWWLSSQKNSKKRKDFPHSPSNWGWFLLISDQWTGWTGIFSTAGTHAESQCLRCTRHSGRSSWASEHGCAPAGNRREPLTNEVYA
jgi:hypothetical protein